MATRRSAVDDNIQSATVKLFLDSSVLFTAVNSPVGGSAKLFTLSKVKLYVSKIVLHEVERNIRNKLQSYHLERFFMLVKKLFIIDEIPTVKQILKANRVIVKKDAVILAEVKKSNCDYLITLDKKDFLQEKINKFIKPKKVLTPRQFFEIYNN